MIKSLFVMNHQTGILFCSSALIWNQREFMDTIIHVPAPRNGYATLVSADGQRLWINTFSADGSFASIIPEEMISNEDKLFCLGSYVANLTVSDSLHQSRNRDIYLIAKAG
jgi:hypothetical protein